MMNHNPTLSTCEAARRERWRLVLGEPAGETMGCELSEPALGMDRALSALYDSDRSGSLGSSCPQVHRWLGDIRRYFSGENVHFLQRDAWERLNLSKLLLEPELLAAIEPDVHLVAALLSLKEVLPARTEVTARRVVQRLVAEVERRLRLPLESAVRGSLARACRTMRPRQHEIDWHRTIQANLRHYHPEQKALVPERLVGFARRRNGLRDVVLCVDQSASMATSLVYSGIFACVLASLRSLRTRFVAFDTSVVDLTDQLHDPVNLLFGTQLGGGTDIQRALAYAAQLVDRPRETTLFLISDLHEAGEPGQLQRRAARLIGSGVQLIVLLALNDEGRPRYHERMAAELAGLGISCFACTPERFPDLLSAALAGESIASWAGRQKVVPP